MTSSLETLPGTAALPEEHWLAGYQPLAGVWDEVVAPDGAVRPVWRTFLQATASLRPEDWAKRNSELARRLRDHGAAFNRHLDATGVARPWELDAVPLLLDRSEFWEVAEGLRQRARLLNAIMADLYGPQRLLAEGWIPPTLIYGNPGYLREVQGAVRRGPLIALLATDLGRTPEGNWVVLAEHTQTPAGKGYALENRLVLAQQVPELFHQCGAQPLGAFLDREGEELAALALSRGDDKALVVLLSPGPAHEAYFEHSFIARQMGVQLVEGADLTVRDRRVYLKTLEGLRRVEVIVRRVRDVDCDPLEWQEEAWLGVAGLVEARRAGHVTVVNAFGSGVVEAPALFPFLPGLCRHLLGEELRLPQVVTWWLGQERERRTALAAGDQWFIKSAFTGSAREPVWLAGVDETTRREIDRALVEEPETLVAQAPWPLSTLPVWNGHGFEPRRLVWRAFTFVTRAGAVVLPGGLVRVSQPETAGFVTMRSGGLSKDVWVLGEGEEKVEVAAAPPVVRPPRTRSGVPSRLADQVFWFGRYAERLEHTVRLVRAGLRRLAGEDTEEQALEQRAVARLMEMSLHVPPVVSTTDGADWAPAFFAALRRLLEDGSLALSVPALAGRLHYNAAAARDRFSDDMWMVVTGLTGLVDALGREAASPRELLQQLDALILQLAALSGMQAENMTRGHGWRFLEFGRRLERCLTLLGCCSSAVLCHEQEPGLLWPLLEIADSTMTYRRLYQAEPHWLAVLDLLLTNEANPRSVAFQLGWLARQSPQLPRDGGTGPTREKEACDQLLSQLFSLNLATLQQAAPGVVSSRIHQFCRSLASGLEGVSELLNAHYFSHAIPKRR